MVGNRVMNRATGKDEPVFWDATHPVLDAPAGVEDVSPEPLLAETLADHLRLFTAGRGKAIALSGKARAAIALAGRLGQAFWFNEQAGRLVTGTAYMKELPAWLRALNDRRLPDAAFGMDWTLALPTKEYLGDDDRPFESPSYGMGRTFPHSLKGGAPSPGAPSYAAFASSPFANDLLVQAAKAAITAEGLGKDDVPDLLAVSFSATDLVYHQYGPYSWEMQDTLVRLDRQIAELLAAAEKAAGGRQNLLVVLSSDHGGAALPEEWIAAGINATRVKPSVLKQGLAQELQSRFGAPVLLGMVDREVYLNGKVLAEKKLDAATVRRAAAEWLGRQPGVALAVSADDLESGQELSGFLPSLRRSHYPGRSGDVTFLLKPYAVFMEGDSGTTHGEPYAYDNQNPAPALRKEREAWPLPDAGARERRGAHGGHADGDGRAGVRRGRAARRVRRARSLTRQSGAAEEGSGPTGDPVRTPRSPAKTWIAGAGFDAAVNGSVQLAQRSTISSERSIALAECVSAPIDT